MSDITLQGGPGVHTGHASIAELQRLHISQDSERGCCGSEPERRMILYK